MTYRLNINTIATVNAELVTRHSHAQQLQPAGRVPFVPLVLAYRGPIFATFYDNVQDRLQFKFFLPFVYCAFRFKGIRANSLPIVGTPRTIN